MIDSTFADSCNGFVNAYIFHQGQKRFNTTFPEILSKIKELLFLIGKKYDNTV